MKLYFPNIQPEPFVYGTYNPICDEAPDSYCLVLELPPNLTLEEVFYFGNNNDAYYENGLRSISVGDVIRDDEGIYWRCEGVGWKNIPAPYVMRSLEEKAVLDEVSLFNGAPIGNIMKMSNSDVATVEKSIYFVASLKRRLRCALQQSAHYKKLYEQRDVVMREEHAAETERWHKEDELLDYDKEAYEGDWRDEQY
jgi:hypothetical protein